jgi:putative colanic acid biosynthesis glycosyltransferase
MPKLLQINVCNNIFSTGKIVSEIGEAAINSGWESYIAYGREYIPSPNVDIKIGNKAEQILHVLESRIFDNTGLGYSSYLATRQLIKEIKKIKPDIIHLHVLSGYYVNIRVLISYLSKLSLPIVWTFHSCWEFTGHCTHFDYERCFKWKEQCQNCPLYKEYPQSWFRDNSSNNYLTKKRLFTSLNNLHVVTVSKWLKEQVEESFFKGCDITYIYNGIDTDLFRPLRQQEELKKKFGLDGEKVLLALSSMWLPKKGINDYLELARRLENNDVKVVLVGYTPDHPNEMPKNIMAMPVTTNRQQLVELYNAADILLNLSYEESFGLTTVEGLACGTPAIVYNRTASPELVDESTGIVVNAGEIDTLVQAVNSLLDKGKDCFTEACRKRAEEQFDKKKSYSKYINLYNKLTNVRI